MKQNFTYLMFSLLFLAVAATNSTAQKRYVDDVFDEVSVTADVTYGVNATLLYLPVVGELVPEELKMDIYEPVGDDVTDRPVVLVFHTGNFLPPVTNSQIAGQRVDSSSVEICKRLARKGYVAASVSYRLGWNPLAESQPERALGLIQAAYRGVQDGLTAVRYLKTTIAAGNQYGIDGDKIVAFGTGTGGYITLGMASLDEYGEIINTTNGPGKFLLDANGDGVPETPMVVEAFHGDIEGKVETVVPADGFGLMAGWVSNMPNHVDESSEFAMSVNIGGACGDLSWIDENTKPIVTVQSPFDIFAPYGDAVLVVPTTNDPIVQVQGGSIIIPANLAAGNQSFADENFNDDATDRAIANSAIAGHDYFEGLYPFIREPNSAGIPEGIVINWWDPEAIAPGLQGMGLAWNALPHPNGGTYHDQGLVLNEGMSAEKARANLDELMPYVLPRMCATLGLGDCLTSSTEDEILADAQVEVSPNPTSGLFTVSLGSETTIEALRISDLQGKEVFRANNLNTTAQQVDASNLTAGMYILQLKVEGGIATTKITIE